MKGRGSEFVHPGIYSTSPVATGGGEGVVPLGPKCANCI